MFATERQQNHGTAALFGVMLVIAGFLMTGFAMLRTVQTGPRIDSGNGVCTLLCAPKGRAG